MEVPEERVEETEDRHWQQGVADNSETLCVADLKRKEFLETVLCPGQKITRWILTRKERRIMKANAGLLWN